MRFLIDVNLPPAWAPFLIGKGLEAVHWTNIGDPRAPDDAIMRHARDNEYVVFTHDLDFGALLALTRATGPSVLQVRAQNVLPDAIGEVVVRAMSQHAAALETGAIVTIDESNARIRVLPIR